MTLLEEMVWLQVQDHPTPWTIDYDWTVEVVDANGVVVIKLGSDSDARQLIGIANRLSNDYAAFRALMDSMYATMEVSTGDESEV